MIHQKVNNCYYYSQNNHFLLVIENFNEYNYYKLELCSALWNGIISDSAFLIRGKNNENRLCTSP